MLPSQQMKFYRSCLTRRKELARGTCKFKNSTPKGWDYVMQDLGKSENKNMPRDKLSHSFCHHIRSQIGTNMNLKICRLIPCSSNVFIVLKKKIVRLRRLIRLIMMLLILKITQLMMWWFHMSFLLLGVLCLDLWTVLLSK